MDTKALRYFWRVYEERSINKAAKQLFITPQGLSRIIQNLEDELGTALFERSSKGMVPTTCGTYLYQKCPEFLNKYDEILIDIQHLSAQQIKLTFGFACGVLNVLPLEKIHKLKELCSCQLQWDEGSNDDVIRRVLEGSCDIGFAIGAINNPALWVKELYCKNIDVIVYEGHPFFTRETLSVQELRNESFITLNEKFHSYHSFVQRCRDFGFTPSIVIKTMESQLIYRFCRQKLGLGIDVNIHKEDLNFYGLKRVGLEDMMPWKISLIVRKDRVNDPLIKRAADLFSPV